MRLRPPLDMEADIVPGRDRRLGSAALVDKFQRADQTDAAHLAHQRVVGRSKSVWLRARPVRLPVAMVTPW